MNLQKYFLIICLISSLTYCNSLTAQLSWVQLNSGTTSTIHDIYFLNDNVGFFSTSFLVKKTTNSGISWDTVFTFSSSEYSNFQFLNSLTGFCMAGNKIIKTTNSGNNWVQYTHSFNGSPRYYMVDSLYGYGASSNGVFKTSNGGENWISLVNVLPMEGVSGVYFYNRNTGYIAGSVHEPISGALYKTTNGGYNWQHVLTTIPDQMNNFNLYNKDTVYLNNSSTLFATNTGGSSWTQVSIPGSFISDVSFPDNDTGYLCGRAGTFKVVDKTTNRGSSWTRSLSYNSTSNFVSVFFLNVNVGYITGQNGLLLKTTNGGLTPVVNLNNNVPGKHTLLQNYPNPFNPVTKVKFDVASSSKIKLIVYNSLGKKITVLVNENLNAGSYETEWNAESFSSGIYYYSLFINNSLIDTKKTVLIK